MATRTQQEDTIVVSLSFAKVKAVLPGRASAIAADDALASGFDADLSAAAPAHTEPAATAAPSQPSSIAGPLALMGCRR